MDRREFLKKCGKAGVALSAAGVLSSSLLQRSPAAEAPTEGPLLVRLSGTPKDMGRQYAEQAGDLIRERLRLLREKGSRVTQELVEQSRIFLNVKANAVLVEIEYMAATLNETEEELLILSAEPPGVGVRRGGCSSFVIDPKVSTDASLWAGENIDDAGELERFGVVIVRHPLDSAPMITWALAGGVGAIGMNEQGVTILMNYMQTGAVRPPVAIFPEFIANSALRQKDFKDAMGVLVETPIMGPCMFLLAGADGNRAIIERVLAR